MSDILRDFIDSQTEEEKKLRQQSMDNASAEGGALPLKVSGTYLMEVATFAYKDKKNNKMRVSPEVFISDTKKSLNLKINMRVVDGTPQAPRGSSIFMNLVLSPSKGADQTKIDNVNRMLKPRLAVLTGEKNIKLSAEWLEEWLIAKFEERDGQYQMVKDHKMKQKFLAIIEDDVYNDKDTLRVASLLEAAENSKSVSNIPDDSSLPSKESIESSPGNQDDIIVNDAIVTEAEVIETDNTEIPDIPAGIEDFQND